jgi:ApbE superfamily uncharacterized protein (UPF0280 family)
MMHEPRVYRDAIAPRRFFFKVRVKETDLFIHAGHHLEALALDLTLKYRSYIEAYIRHHPGFSDSLIPVQEDRHAPAIVRDMIEAGRKARVGPMAAVAGAVAEYVGRELLTRSPDVIVENGGDIFIRTDDPATIAVFAGNSPLSMKVGLKINGSGHGVGVCTSSGTIGHSLSFGSADAVCVVSSSCALADASATAVGNVVRSAADIKRALAFGKKISGIEGILIIRGDRLGAWGSLEIVPIGRQPSE